MIEEILPIIARGHPPLDQHIRGRLYPVPAPQGTELPFAYYQIISTSRPHSLTGGSGLAKALVQITVVAATKEIAAEVVFRWREAMQGKRTPVTGASGVVYDVNGIFMRDERDGYDENFRAPTQSADFEVWYNESQPTPV